MEVKRKYLYINTLKFGFWFLAYNDTIFFAKRLHKNRFFTYLTNNYADNKLVLYPLVIKLFIFRFIVSVVSFDH